MAPAVLLRTCLAARWNRLLPRVTPPHDRDLRSFPNLPGPLPAAARGGRTARNARYRFRTRATMALDGRGGPGHSRTPAWRPSREPAGSLAAGRARTDH